MVVFLRIRSHGKSPLFTTIWDNMFGTFLRASNQQIQVINGVIYSIYSGYFHPSYPFHLRPFIGVRKKNGETHV